MAGGIPAMPGDYTILDVERDRERWLELIQGSDAADVYFSPGFHETFRDHESGAAKLFVYEHDGRHTLFPVLLRDIPGSDRRDVSTVYGYGGVLVPKAGQEDAGYQHGLLSALSDWYQQKRVVAEFIRYHPVLATHLCSPIPTRFIRHTVVVDTGRALDAIWSDYRSNTRRKVRQARRAGLRFEMWSRPERLRAFADLYRATMARRNAAAFYRFPESFLRRHFEHMPGSTYLAVVELEGETIAAALFLGWGTRLSYHLGGSKERALDLRPNDALMHGVIEWAHEQGFTTVHLGGGYAGDDSLFSFKRGFSRRGCREFHISRRVVDPDAYGELVEAWQQRVPRDATYDADFFPRYRVPLYHS